jgi:hypothetical protein
VGTADGVDTECRADSSGDFAARKGAPEARGEDTGLLDASARRVLAVHDGD